MATTSTASTRIQFAQLIPIWASLIAQRIVADASPGYGGTGLKALHFGNIGPDSTTPLGPVLGMLVLDWVLYTLLFVYFDMVVKVGPGVKYHPLFFAKASFWKKSAPTDPMQAAQPPPAGEAAEVSEERKRTLTQVGGVRALGLSKIYPGAKKYAVESVQFGILPDECFGLLGSNGAGKSTTIHMLCGVHAPSSGTVLCGDNSELDTARDMPTIQAAMGVCTQDNLLWGELTGTEHLRFFGRLRRLSPRELTKHIDYWLKRVNLASRADRRKRSRAYSGGMKRRLSVANAFIGNPRLVCTPARSSNPPDEQTRAREAVTPGKQPRTRARPSSEQTSTSRPPASTLSRAASCGTRSSPPRSPSRSSSPRMRSRRPRRSATASAS